MGLNVTDLCCERSGRVVLDELSFAVAPGEALILRGPNGAGKSTLLRALAGLLAPRRGEIRLDDVSQARDGDGYAEGIAYAGHLDAIKPQLTIAENLDFWAALYGGEGIDAALERFDLRALSDRPAHACSAGQKRRLGLARLLVARRRLWLLDEPTVSLDAAAVARFGAVTREHCAAGGLAVIATHIDLDLGPSRALTLTPPVPGGADRASSDPFLSGAWT